MDRQARAIGATLQLAEMAGKRALLLYPPALEYEAAIPFGLESGPLFRVIAYVRPGCVELLLVAHHSVMTSKEK